MKVDKRMQDFIREAYETVPMYQSMGSGQEQDEWDNLPVLDKNNVVKSGASAISMASIPLLLQNKLIAERTSGSTGKYMEIYWREDDYKKSMLPLWYYRNKYYGIKPDDKLCFFYTIHQVSETEETHFYNKNSLGFSKSNMSFENLLGIYKKMQEYEPKWLMLQPGMAVLLCECMDRYNLGRIESVKYIEFSGEILTDSIRKMVKEHFGCVVANMYGANEFNGIAYECPCGNMHVFSDNVHVEEEKGTNELLITTRTNKAMPLIRYRIGDMGKLIKNEKCQCGNRNDILELFSGRVSDFIVCGGGEKKTPYAIVRAIEGMNYVMEGLIKQFQIEQTDIRKFIIRLVVDMEDELFDESYIEELFGKYLTDEELREAEYAFEYFEELFPDEVTGKYRYFIRNSNL